MKLFHTIFKTTLGKISLSLLMINLFLGIFDIYKISQYVKFVPVLLISFILFVVLCLILLSIYKLPKLSIFFNILLAILLLIGTVALNRASSFSSAITNTKEVEAVQIVVKKESTLDSRSDLNEKVMGIFIDDEIGLERALEILKEHNKEGVKIRRYDNMLDAYNALLNDEIDLLVFSSLSTSYLEEEIIDYYDYVRVLFEKEYELEDIVTMENVDITKEPFVVYLGGVDLSFNGKINGAARGDVNILLVVNPTTKKAILQVVPRDLYAYNPVKDASSKLSWSGKWGGVQSSVYSIQHELGIKINYYAKINFAGFKDLIDAIGGIDVYSHYTYSTAGYSFVNGMNYGISGEQALAMARERKSLPLNERSRGLQQMEIIKGIMNKIYQNPSFDNLMATLDSIQNSFMTNLPEDKFLDAFNLFLSMKDTFLNIETYSMEGEIIWHEDEVIGGNYYYFYPSEAEKEKVRDRINAILLGE
ncbi:MAG: LCP family protein [Traorella sp.]